MTDGSGGGSVQQAAEMFLEPREPLNWRPPTGFPADLSPVGRFDQQADNGLEVAVATSRTKPSAKRLREAHKTCRGNRASPVLLVVFHPGQPESHAAPTETKVTLCGPVGDQPPILRDVDPCQADRLADTALDEPSHHAATRFLLANLPEVDSPTPGLRNSGLLATQELRAGLPERPDWAAAVERSKPLLRLGGRALVERLGFGVQPLGATTWMLTAEGRNQAVAVFCDPNEPFDSPANRFEGSSPVSRALAEADTQRVPWVLLTRARELRLYAARSDTGVGRKGRAETFVEVNLALLPSEKAGYLGLLFSADALKPKGTIEEVLDNSSRFAAELAKRLRERVYYDTVPILARALARRLGDSPTTQQLDHTYQQVMVILFRLLFLAYAEDKDLLPFRTNSRYRDKSLTHAAQQLLEDLHNPNNTYEQHFSGMWQDVQQLWQAVNEGNTAWGVPAYNGGLFSDDPAVSPAGASLASLALNDAEFAPALQAMLIDHGPEGEGLVDFRSLSVREFGTIYEGLLESRLTIATEDLTVTKAKGGNATYAPAKVNDPVEVHKDEVYLHNRSGVRKATGSYFTKPFAVEHLLDHALEPALDDHLDRLDSLYECGDEAALEKAFFDFRCADIAMGSGHFLVAALDRIEARLSAWLTLHPVPAVSNELQRLRGAALESLGDLADGVEIESTSLLRRQVARHCVYGVDKNPIAVELARVAIWVHTFVPGLPLSFLDHNLVCGDSLTGVGTLDEAMAALEPKADPDKPSLFRGQIEEMLAGAKQALRRLAITSDATKAEVEQARQAHEDARAGVAGATAVFDVIAAHRAGACDLPERADEQTFLQSSQAGHVPKTIQALQPLHFPSAFPEVFVRERPGFDCLLGNPPWEKVVVDREVWWGMHLPGIRGRSVPVSVRRAKIDALEAQRPDLAEAYSRESKLAEELKLLLRRAYPDLGSGQTDLYKAFAWANFELARPGGKIGIVLPRSAVADAGMTKWRQRVLDMQPDPPPGRASPGGLHSHQSPRVGVRRRTPLLHGGARGGNAIIGVATCLNTKQWAFDDVDGRYTVALVTTRKLRFGRGPASRTEAPPPGRGVRCDLSRPGLVAAALSRTG